MTPLPRFAPVSNPIEDPLNFVKYFVSPSLRSNVFNRIVTFEYKFTHLFDNCAILERFYLQSGTRRTICGTESSVYQYFVYFCRLIPASRVGRGGGEPLAVFVVPEHCYICRMFVPALSSAVQRTENYREIFNALGGKPRRAE